MTKKRGWPQISAGLGFLLLLSMGLTSCTKIVVLGASSEDESKNRPPTGKCRIAEDNHCVKPSGGGSCSCY